jgi:hypothetical protein
VRAQYPSASACTSNANAARAGSAYRLRLCRIHVRPDPNLLNGRGWPRNKKGQVSTIGPFSVPAQEAAPGYIRQSTPLLKAGTFHYNRRIVAIRFTYETFNRPGLDSGARVALSCVRQSIPGA